jgi:probable addiction module antidote protein
MALQTTPFDPAEHLETPEDIAVFLTDAFESADPGVIAHALGIVARAKGMTQLAKDAGLGRQNLYRALSEEGKPELATVVKLLNALGLKLTATAAASEAA